MPEQVQPALTDREGGRPPRKTRSDKGKRRPHPPTCRHCTECVALYREARQAEEYAIEFRGGWRDEAWRSQIITFHKWLRRWRYRPADEGPTAPLPADAPEGTQRLWDQEAARGVA